jgi:serine/threonine-protein kinase HipA
VSLEVAVQLPSGREIAAGTLDAFGPAGREVVEFRYSNEYLGDREAYALSTELPLTSGPFTPSGQRTMLGGIADAQHDLWGRRLIDARRRSTARDLGEIPQRASELEVLSAVPDETREGALRVRDDQEYLAPISAAVPGIADISALVAAARAFDAGEAVPADLARLIAAGTSGGGARPKASVRTAAGTLAIAKFPRDDDFGDAMAWEATALTLARRAGVSIPPFQLLRLGYRSVLVIERFDRVAGRRVGYQSADSLLVKQPHDIVDYVAFMDALAPVSAAPRADSEELFRRIALTLLLNNVDDHMKNHGLLRERTGWRLSPAFDINPFFREGSVDSTPITAQDDPGNRDIRLLVAARDVFSLTHERALTIIRTVAEVTSTWRETAQELGITAEAVDAMSTAFENCNRALVESLAG